MSDTREPASADEPLSDGVSEEHFRQAIRAADIGIFDNNHVTGVVRFSSRMREIHGLPPNGPVSLADIMPVIHPADAERFGAMIRASEDPTGDGAIAIEHRLLLPDGAVRWVSTRGQVYFEGHGAGRRPARTVGAVIDVTERMQVMDDLSLKTQAVESSLTGLAITNNQCANIYANAAFLRMWGLKDPADVRGRQPNEFFEGTKVFEALAGIQKDGHWQGELVARRSDGSTFDVMLSANAIVGADGALQNVVVSFLDISESKTFQAQFLQAQKMESIGRLAGGVAHDFNNLLTVIRGYVELALHATQANPGLSEQLREVSKAAESATVLTRQLLAFSRKETIDPQVLQFGDVLGRAQSMLPRLLGEDIALRVRSRGGLWPVLFDPHQAVQVLINLAVNARDAMPQGGELTFDVMNITMNAEDVRTRVGMPAGDYVLLCVSDTGVGMSREVKEHLFEPFFTTKPSGHGTGLGLAMVYGAVSQNGGWIDVMSQEGRGTTFSIYLPRAADVPVESAPEHRDAAPRGHETVVLVEDSPDVRTFATTVLERQGYRTIVCADGLDALRKIAATSGPIDLLVTDVVMPVMNGRVLSEKIEALRPGLRVLYTSGYPHDVISQHGVMPAGINFLAKPYSVAALAKTVRDVLDRPR